MDENKQPETREELKKALEKNGGEIQKLEKAKAEAEAAANKERKIAERKEKIKSSLEVRRKLIESDRQNRDARAQAGREAEREAVSRFNKKMNAQMSEESLRDELGVIGNAAKSMGRAVKEGYQNVANAEGVKIKIRKNTPRKRFVENLPEKSESEKNAREYQDLADVQEITLKDQSYRSRIGTERVRTFPPPTPLPPPEPGWSEIAGGRIKNAAQKITKRGWGEKLRNFFTKSERIALELRDTPDKFKDFLSSEANVMRDNKDEEAVAEVFMKPKEPVPYKAPKLTPDQIVQIPVPSSQPETLDSPGMWPDLSKEIKAEIKKEIEKIPSEERVGFVKRLWGMGFEVEKLKNKFFANVFNGIEKKFDNRIPEGGKSEDELEDVVYRSKKRTITGGTMYRWTKALRENFIRKANKAEQQQKDLYENKGGLRMKLNSPGLIGRNAIKYYRIISDLTTHHFASPLRYVMMAGAAWATGSEAAKEARLENQDAIEKTRIQDAQKAYDEAWNIYDNARLKEQTGIVSAEALKSAYLREIPKDVQKRLENPGTGNTFMQFIVKSDIEGSIKRTNFFIERIKNNKNLSSQQKEASIEALLKRQEGNLRDWDRIVSQYGTVDILAMAGRYSQTAGKAVVAGVSLETMYLSLEKIWENVSNLLATKPNIPGIPESLTHELQSSPITVTPSLEATTHPENISRVLHKLPGAIQDKDFLGNPPAVEGTIIPSTPTQSHGMGILDQYKATLGAPPSETPQTEGYVPDENHTDEALGITPVATPDTTHIINAEVGHNVPGNLPGAVDPTKLEEAEIKMKLHELYDKQNHPDVPAHHEKIIPEHHSEGDGTVKGYNYESARAKMPEAEWQRANATVNPYGYGGGAPYGQNYGIPREVSTENIPTGENIPDGSAVSHQVPESFGLGKNVYGLSSDKLELVSKTYNLNLRRLFPSEEIEEQVKSFRKFKANDVLFDDQLGMEEAKDGSPFGNIYFYLKILQAETGEKPIKESFFRDGETIEQYVSRALQKAAKIGKLEQVLVPAKQY